MKTLLLLDSCIDLPKEMIDLENVELVTLSYNYKHKDHIDDLWQTASAKEFYDALREGEISTTSQINVHVFAECFDKYVEQGYEILYLAFSSGLSGTCNSATIAAQQLMEENPNANITVVDSLAASMGEGLLAWYAINMLKEGKSKDEIATWLIDNRLNLAHWFTVEDLHFLKRGGRVSSAAAVIGTALSIMPILHVDNEGHLIPKGKTRGRKKALRALVDEMEKTVVNPEEQVIFISHGDSLKDAEYTAKLVRERFNVKDIVINPIGPVIGSHSGPGTIALFFLANTRG